MTPALGRSAYRWNNNIKSTLLVAAFPCLLVGLVAFYFLINGWQLANTEGFIDPTAIHHTESLVSKQKITIRDYVMIETGLIAPIVLVLAGIWIVVGLYFHEWLISIATHANHLARKDAPELYNMVENLCISRGLTTPKLYIIKSKAMNAYASGLTENSFAITITRGLIDGLDKNELEAVLAHELSHIINRDVRLLVVSALFGGLLAFFPELTFNSILYTHIFLKDSGEEDAQMLRFFPFVIIFMLRVAMFVLTLGYLASLVFRMALSQHREYLADAGSVELTKRPETLISALEKIKDHSRVGCMVSGVEGMLFENPRGSLGLLNSHPRIEDRIAVLRREVERLAKAQNEAIRAS